MVQVFRARVASVAAGGWKGVPRSFTFTYIDCFSFYVSAHDVEGTCQPVPGAHLTGNPRHLGLLKRICKSVM